MTKSFTATMVLAVRDSGDLDNYLAGDGATPSTRLTGESGRVELALEADGAGRLVRCTIALGG